MLSSIRAAFARAAELIGHLIGRLLALVAWPFVALGRWLGGRSWIIKAPFALVVMLLVGLYGYFLWNTQVWSNFDPDYAARYASAQPTASTATSGTTAPAIDAGQAPAAEPAAQNAAVVSQPVAGADGVEGEVRTCVRSGIVDATADLIDFNVNQNAWVSSNILYKVGLFGLDWDRTPFLDNKAAFQRGVNQAIRRTTVELVDALGRVRGTSQIDGDLQDARGNMQFDEYTWYFGLSPFGPKTPTPSYYRAAMRDLRSFNDRMQSCAVQFDARGDNLLQFVERIASDLGSTSAILRERSETYNSGWFDTRADDRFWFAYGQLYGYYGILTAARHDFAAVVQNRGLTSLWQELEQQIHSALRIQPAIISNGSEDGWIMPTHLATMGFYVLRVRSNLVEIRAVLDR